MRRIFQLSMACLAAGVVSACSDPAQVVQTEVIPTAGVRFINAVPDTGAAGGLDFRFVDIVENNAQFQIAFRNNPVTAGGFTESTKIEFKPARAGTRFFKIFLDDTLQSVATTVLNTPTLPIDPISASVMPNDTTLTLVAGKNYTIILWGNARGGATPMKITAFEDDPADPAANVALRVINATSGVINASAYLSAGPAPATPTWANVPAFSVSTFVTSAPGAIRYDVTGAATVSGTAIPGTANTVDVASTPGTTIAGSAVTAIVFPASVAGSKAPQGGVFNAAQMSFTWDRRPPRGCNPSLC